MAENPTPSLTHEQRQRLLNWRPAPNTPAKDRLNQRIQQQAQGVGLDDQSFGNFAAIQQAKGNFTDQEVQEIADAMGPVARDSTIALTKGAVVGTAAGAADIFGMLQALAEPPAMKLAREQGYLPDLVTGNTLRELVDLDPNDAFGMIGESFGGLEALVAKVPVIGAKVFGTLATAFPDQTLAMVYAAAGIRNLKGKPGIALMESAAKMLDDGVNPATVMEKTGGWYRDKNDGIMKIAFSDAEAYIDESLLRALADNAVFNAKGEATITTTIGEALQGHPTLLTAYPQLQNMPLTYHIVKKPDGGYAIFDQAAADAGMGGQADSTGITVFLDDDQRFGRSTLLHEIQHQIQTIEGFAGGSNPLVWTKAIEAIRDLTIKDRAIKALGKGKLAEDASDVDVDAFILELYKKLGVKDETIPSALRSEIRGYTQTPLDELDREVQGIRSRLDFESRTIGTMLNELGLKADDASVKEFLDKDASIINGAALTRYKNQAGEVEARIVQFLEDKTQAELEAIRVPLNELAPEVGTPLDRVIGNVSREEILNQAKVLKRSKD